ncbi:MAG: helix-turn-helix domain-containing protein [Actinomycetota bacterium]
MNGFETSGPSVSVDGDDLGPSGFDDASTSSPQRSSLRRGVSVLRRTPPAPLDRLVERIWQASWALAPGQQVAPEVVTHPAVTLTFEQGLATITGLGSLRYRRELVGRGRVLGLVFRPGCFRPLLGRPVETLTEQSIPAHEVFGPSMLDLQEALRLPMPLDRQIALLVDYFGPMVPPERTPSEAVAELVHYITREPGINGVGDVCRRLGLGRRQLHRIFSDHVGVSPKWVIERRRLSAGEPIVGPQPTPRWGELARELSLTDGP